MNDAKPVQNYRLKVLYPPSKTKVGAYVKDEDGVKNFGKADLLDLEQGDLIDVKRTHNPAKGGYDASFNIISWTRYGSATTNHPDQQQLPITPPKPFLRPRTDPADQRQMWVTALMKEWMAAYSQALSITTTGEMKKVDAGVMEQAARACGVTYDRLFGPMTTRPAPPEEDMDDAIPWQ